MSALFDTSIVLDYLRGVTPADVAFARFPQRSITVVTWAEVMFVAPADSAVRTRHFLRHFERLSINESIVDHALELQQQHPRLPLRYAIPWAAARHNSLTYVTADFPKLNISDATLLVPYRARRR